MNMIAFLRQGAAIAALLVWASPTLGQSRISDRYEEFLKDKPPLQLTEPQRQSIVDAVALEHTHQLTPKGFKPEVGMKVEKAIHSNPMPRPLVYEIPLLRQYYYAKLDRNVLVIEPMSQKVVEVLPRKWPSAGTKPLSAVEWAGTRGRELIGLQPEGMSETTGSGASRGTR
jgi:hypothetical protein